MNPADVSSNASDEECTAEHATTTNYETMPKILQPTSVILKEADGHKKKKKKKKPSPPTRATSNPSTRMPH
jgi:hypothetical protein